MIIKKELGYFEPSLVRGDIVKTRDFWAVIQSSKSYDDIESVYKYSIIEEYNFKKPNTSYPGELYPRMIEAAFESAQMEDIKDEYPEYFL